MRLTVPEGMAPAAVYDVTSRQYLCRDCADRCDQVVLVDDDTHVCACCGESITTPERYSADPADGAVDAEQLLTPTGAAERGERP
jgi:hypothetical protein